MKKVSYFLVNTDFVSIETDSNIQRTSELDGTALASLDWISSTVISYQALTIFSIQFSFRSKLEFSFLLIRHQSPPSLLSFK